MSGGGNPVSSITDSISNALGTDGSGGGLLGGISNVAQSIGSIGAQLDNSVRQVIPGGWATLGAVAAMIAAPYAAPELFAAATPADLSVAEGSALAGTGSASLTPTADAILASGTGAGAGAGTGAATSVGLGAGAGAAAPMTGVAGLGGSLGTGLTLGGAGASALSPAVQAMLSAAGTGALTGGALGGVNSAIKGTDPLTGILSGALMGGLTGASLSSVSSLLTANGIDSAVAQPMAQALVGASKSIAAGADPMTVLENTALSTGLGQLSKAANNLIGPDVGTTASNIATSAGTGALASAVKGGDVGSGALSGAAGGVGGAIGSCLLYTSPSPRD